LHAGIDLSLACPLTKTVDTAAMDTSTRN